MCPRFTGFAWPGICIVGGMDTTSSNDRKHLLDLVKTFHNGMLVTQADGELECRPMTVAQLEESTGNLWFLTRNDSKKVGEVLTEPEVGVTFQDGAKFVTIVGRAAIIRDQAKIEALWKEPYKVWFTEGKTDPSILLIEVEPLRGEYWDNTGVKKLKFLFNAAKAILTGERPATDRDQHSTVNLRP